MAEEKRQVKKELPFYERKGPVVFCRIAGIAAGVFLLVSPFLSWRVVFVKADKLITERCCLFDVVKYVFSRSYIGGAGKKLLIAFCFIMILLVGIAFLYLSFRDQFRPGTAAESKFLPDRLITRFRLISRAALPVVAILAKIILTHNSVHTLVFQRVQNTYDGWKSMISQYVRYHGDDNGMFVIRLPGAGCFLFYLGFLLFIVAECYRYVINTLNEED